LRDTTSKFYHIDTAHDIAAAISNHFAVLGGEYLSQLIHMCIDQLFVSEHDSRTALRVFLRPSALRDFSGGDRLVEFTAIRQRDFCLNRARIRIENVRHTARRAIHPFTIYEMSDCPHVYLRRF